MYVIVNSQNVLLWLECRHGNICFTGQCYHRRRSVPLQLTHQSHNFIHTCNQTAASIQIYFEGAEAKFPSLPLPSLLLPSLTHPSPSLPPSPFP